MTLFYLQNWAPPTPPQDDNDVYIDRSMCFMYEPNVMLESQLPAIYVKREQKRIRIDPAVGKYTLILHNKYKHDKVLTTLYFKNLTPKHV
jgi:E1A-binding protein p400